MTHETHDIETRSQLKKNIIVDRGSGLCYHDTIGEHHHVCVYGCPCSIEWILSRGDWVREVDKSLGR